MRKVLAVFCSLFLASSIVLASENSWRLNLRVSDSIQTDTFTWGVAPTGLDGVDTNDGVDNMSLHPAPVAEGLIPGSTSLWLRVIHSPASPMTYPDRIKRWEIRVGEFEDGQGNVLRLGFYSVSSTLLPPASDGGYPVGYRLVMINNRGVAGAPANGTTWEIPIPTAHILPPIGPSITLPVLRVPRSYAGVLSGYAMELHQYVVPEQASVMALGMGAAALGLALKRRRK